MAKSTTRDAALNRLFGNAQDAPASEANSKDVATTKASAKIDKSLPDTGRKPERRDRGESLGEPNEGGVGDKSGQSAPLEEQAPSIYMGRGRYARVGGVVERITPYIRPDQAEALRLAAARRNDPRGADISQIIQTLLDEAGYGT